MAIDSPWTPDEHGVQPGGDCGGDYQVTESYSRRFVRPGVPGAMITVSFYGVACHDADGVPTGEYAVEEQTEMLVCTDPADPGGTEVWSDYAYRDVNVLAIADEAEAERKARRFAEGADMYGCGWDGRPVYE